MILRDKIILIRNISLFYRFYDRKSKKEYIINSSKEAINQNLSIILKKKGKHLFLKQNENLYYGYIKESRFKISTNYFLSKSDDIQYLCIEGEISSVEQKKSLVKVQYEIQDLLKKYIVVLIGPAVFLLAGVFNLSIIPIMYSFIFYLFADLIFLLVSLSDLSSSKELFEKIIGA